MARSTYRLLPSGSVHFIFYAPNHESLYSDPVFSYSSSYSIRNIGYKDTSVYLCRRQIAENCTTRLTTRT